MYGSLARKPERCKVVVRNLPPTMSQEEFMLALKQTSDQYDWTSFVPGKARTHAHVLAFKTAFAKRIFADGSSQQPCVVEYAPFQKVPQSRTKRDPRENTIETDADYVAFVADLEKDREALPSAEAQIERQAAAATGAADEGKRVIVTPLMQYLAEKHALKAPAAKAAAAKAAGTGRGANGQRKGAGAARLRSMSLAPVAEAEESDPSSAAAALAAAVDAKPVRKDAAANSNPRSAARAAALRALGKSAVDAADKAAQSPAKATSRPAPASPDPKVRPGYGAWAPKTLGRLAANQPAQASRPAGGGGGRPAANDPADADKAAAVKQARAAASKAAAVKVAKRRGGGGGGGTATKDADPG